MPLATMPDAPFGLVVRQMNKLMDQIKGFHTFTPGETWKPSVNLYENEDAYVVCVDLAGVDKDKIDLSVVEGRLRLHGCRPVPSHPDRDAESPRERWRVHLMEIDNGRFQREVQLPEDTHTEGITAVYRSGLLWIEIPKR